MADDITHRFAELVRRELHAREVVLRAQPFEAGAGSQNAETDPRPPSSSTDVQLVVDLHDGRSVVATFDEPLADAAAALRRLEILVRAFESVLLAHAEPRKRAPVAVSLRAELRALVRRTDAVDAVVIDAHSPVIWASCFERDEPHGAEPSIPGHAQDTLRLVRESHRGVLVALGDVPDALDWGENDASDDEGPPDSTIALSSRSEEAQTAEPTAAEKPRAHLRLAEPPPNEPASEPDKTKNAEPDWDAAEATEALPEPIRQLRHRALNVVRAHPQMALLHKGGHLYLTVRNPNSSGGADGLGPKPSGENDPLLIARSFAGIYALVVIFAAPFDEIRAERALKDSLPRIERLVLALPPLEPDPVPAGVVALRPRRRR